MSGKNYFTVPVGVYVCLRDGNHDFIQSAYGPATYDLTKLPTVRTLTLDIDDVDVVWLNIDGIAVRQSPIAIDVKMGPGDNIVHREDGAPVLVKEVYPDDAELSRGMRLIAEQKVLNNTQAAYETVASMDVAAGLEDLEMGAARIEVDAKKMINCRADLNQLVPFKYDWAWTAYLESCEKHWMPQEVDLRADMAQWLNRLGFGDDVIIKRSLGFLSTLGSLTSNNLILAIYRLVTNPEARQYLLRQAMEEATHGHAAMHCIQAIGLTEADVYNEYRSFQPVIKRVAFISKFDKSLGDPTFHTGTPETDQRLLRDLIAFYVIKEGIYNLTEFKLMAEMGTRDVMYGLSTIFIRVLEDRARHLEFGINVINAIKAENPSLWSVEFQDEVLVMLHTATLLEIEYNNHCGVPMHDRDDGSTFIKFVANKRMMALGFPEQFSGIINPLKWMEPLLGMHHDEKKVDEPAYQSSSGLAWD